jgi:hypothetical protein
MQPLDDQSEVNSRFEELLLDIVAFETGDDPSDDVVEQIKTILDDDGLDTDDEVPEWIARFFRALHTRRPIPGEEQPERSTDAEIIEFFADLQDVEAFDCYDHGEWVRVRLPRHGMLGFFSVQHAYFTVVALDDVPDDAGSDLSVAKTYSAPDRSDSGVVESMETASADAAQPLVDDHVDRSRSGEREIGPF